MFYTSVTFTFLMADHSNSFFPTFFPWDNFSRCFCTHFAVFKQTPSIWRSMIVGKLKYFVNLLAGPWTWGGFPYQNDLLWKRPCNEYNVFFPYLATKARIISFTQDLNHPLASEDRPKGWGMSEFQQRTLRKSPLTWENQNSPIFQRVGGWATQSNKYESKHESSAFRKKNSHFPKGSQLATTNSEGPF